MRKIVLTSVDSGSAHACGLAVGLKKHGKLTVVWQNKNLHNLDAVYNKQYRAHYGFSKLPRSADDLIIVACITWDRLKQHFGVRFKTWLMGFGRVHIIVSDGRFARNPRYYNREFEGHDVLTTGCKRHFREPLPVKTYYQPFDFSEIDCRKFTNLTVGHSPFVQKKFREKGTNRITLTVKERGLNYDLITGVPWMECIKRKARCHIFIDQVEHYALKKFRFKTGDYIWPALGKSGIEAMHLGCCVMTYGKGYDTDIPAPPVAWTTTEDFWMNFDSLLASPEKRQTLAQQQYEWALTYATPEFASKQVLK